MSLADWSERAIYAWYSLSCRYPTSTKPTMKMKRGISISILLILALQLALLLAGALADDRAIRLPSDGKGAGEISSGLAAAGEGKQKPWGDCCDGAICNRKLPPGCRCTDRVESCSSDCKDCVQVSDDPPRYVCQDWYDFDLDDWNKYGIPKCKEGKQKPWGGCCDGAICNRKYPPGCSCRDRVESCSSACKDCKQVSEDPPRYVCYDLYDFDVEEAPFEIPRCKEAKQKPWGDCCDMASCNRKLPPGCTCRDRVESCSSACKDCVQVSDDPPQYVCQDSYDFDLDDWNKYGIPKCTE